MTYSSVFPITIKLKKTIATELKEHLYNLIVLEKEEIALFKSSYSRLHCIGMFTHLQAFLDKSLGLFVIQFQTVYGCFTPR